MSRTTLGILAAAGLAALAIGIVPLASGGSASAATSTISGRCSKAEATAVVKRLHLGEADFIPNPVYVVLCGAFVGPGSQVMVASLASGGTSVPFEGWAVFRLAGGAWQLVMQRKDGAQVSAAGSDIRETVNISRLGDPRCCPTGGAKSRLWHWIGSRFVASPWKQVTQGKPGPTVARKKPTSRERADVVRALVNQLKDDSPNVIVRVSRVLVATVAPGKRSTYSGFAAASASASARDSGAPLGSVRAVVGLSRRLHVWIVIDYGTDQVGCVEPQRSFGGRRTAILRNLGFGC